MKPKTVTDIKVGEIKPKGFASAYSKEHNKKLKIWNALPSEEVTAEFHKSRKGYWEGRAIEVLTSSPHRTSPVEEHFLSCSPWQIMDIELENQLKLKLATEIFDNHEIKLPDKLDIVTSKKQFNYRNKMEFSFYGDEAGRIHLAFHKRGTSRGKYMIKGCQLAEKVINSTAQKVILWLNSLPIEARQLKTLIIRSNNQGQSIAALFVKDNIRFETLPKLDEAFLGFKVYFSDPKSPASVVTDELYSIGLDSLTAQLNNTSLKFGLNSFFQVNISVFESTLEDISNFLSAGDHIVDFYSGVGSIALPLHKKFNEAVLVESNAEAVDYALKNIQINQIQNAKAVLSRSEEIIDLITSDKTIIFDPPRAGLHQDVIDQVIESKPKRIIYLSCNILTQAENIMQLDKSYKVKFAKIYNFFPNTPHFESLVVLDKN